ncbi:CapA family protein [Moraxella equi]|uniref:Bacterial capsule synthesis protein PGA_cap n=1 Tax=Moraxella equi TaxID=60442 RepID=A0A378QS20_9GAMM|nr:CapA family protein [Moraxella equi]OPH38328.1 capsule biosynthesis protein CapA [Moraxella equi]STZ03481.1 Bacterial capsule synthesis protein PGA_cap [Moraxella equi]
MSKISLLSFIIASVLCQSCSAETQNAISQQLSTLGDTASTYKNNAVSYFANKFNDDFEYNPTHDNNTIVSDEVVISDDDLWVSYGENDEINTHDEFVNIVAVGDIMIGSSFPNVGFLPPNDGRDSFKYVKPYLKGDVVFGNLEGVLLDEGNSTKCPNAPTIDPETGQSKPMTCYAFRMPTRYAKIIKDAGFNVLSLANNHTGDFGDIGRNSTKATLADVGIYYAGLLSKPATTFTKNGVKYGMVAFAPNIGTLSINDLETAKKYVKELDKKVDIVIVSFHGGAEGAEHTRVPKTTEMYLNENRGDVYKFSHSLIDMGADIVIGHGPNITRAVEVYQDRFIAYSLGNFNTYGAFNVRGLNGIAPIINVTMQKDGKFVSADVVSIYQTKEHGLRIDKQNRAFGELKRLTELDFPNSGLKFSNNKITR